MIQTCSAVVKMKIAVLDNPLSPSPFTGPVPRLPRVIMAIMQAVTTGNHHVYLRRL